MTNANPERVKAATDALEAVRGDWMSRQGVVSVEVARRWSDGVPTGEVGIRVTVEKILPSDEVPEGELFPDELESIPVDIVEGTAPVPE